MALLTKGRYQARLATTSGDIERALALRDLRFRAGQGAAPKDQSDRDHFDSRCLHVLVEDMQSGDLVCCYRLIAMNSGAEIDTSYSAQFYDLSRLAGFAGKMLELGRFCTQRDRQDADILRVAWGALTRLVDQTGVEMLFGCSSFEGARPEPHAAALTLLARTHLAPQHWRPKEKAAQVFRFAEDLSLNNVDLRLGLKTMPPLLRTYMAMGGWVSDHAVIDHELDTLHVFAGVEIANIPPARVRLLRAVAG